MRRIAWAATCAAAVLSAAGRATAGVVVEQIEAFEVDTGDNPKAPTRYAPVDFGGAATLAGTGEYAGVTLHGDPTVGLTTTFSFHAQVVGNLFFGVDQSPAHAYVSDVYTTEADAFLSAVVNVQETTGVAAAPGTFAGGAQVINNSYVGDFGATAADVDSQRRIDFMIAQSGATFVAAAATGLSSTKGVPDADPAVWSSFNALAVSGSQTFDPTRSTGKPHADLSFPGVEASFATAIVSSYAAGLVGRATAAGQADATRDVVVRSLLLAGADKAEYAPTTANHLDPHDGAGQPDYDAAVAILQGGERSLAAVTATSVTATPGTTQQGWTAGTVAAGGRSAVLFTVPVSATGLTASLNWDVTQTQPAAGMIDTSNAGVVFPNLTLSVYPVTKAGTAYTLGTAEPDASLTSAATGDNVQYLYDTAVTLPAGTYAFVVGGDPSLPAAVGLSYALRGTFASAYTAAASGSWGAAANWSDGIPNGPAALATVAAGSSPLVVTLDGDRRVGQLTLSAPGGVTVAAGTGGTLTFDDAGDSNADGVATLLVNGGSQAITAPVALANGLTVNASAGSAVTLAGSVTGTGGLTKVGAGSLLLAGADAYGDTTVTAGTLTLANAASVNGNLAVTGGRAAFAAGPVGGGIAAQTVVGLNVSGGSVVLAPSLASADRTVLVASSLSLSGGQLDLGNGDLIVHNASLAAITTAAAAGFAGGTWNGSGGLTSTAAAADPNHLTALGVVQNNTSSGAALYSTFDGQPAVATDVLARYTYYGDTNLDGVVNGADYLRVDAGYFDHLTGWANGDFNYDGVVDGSDYTLMDNAFDRQAGVVAAPSAQLAAAEVATVPEPATALGVGLAVTGVLGRRSARRRRRWA